MFEEVVSQLGIPVWIIALVLIWSLTWKGLALWKSARLNQPIWFIALLLINTLGLLEILYLFLFSRINLENIKQIKTSSKSSSSKKRRRK